jgi:hypothetical protein
MDILYQPAPDGCDPWVDLDTPTLGQQSPPRQHYSGLEFMAVEATYGIPTPSPHVSSPSMTPSLIWCGIPTQRSCLQDTSLAPQPVAASVRSSSQKRRKTLTGRDRQNICLYHKENKEATQADIAGKISHTAFLKSYLASQYTDLDI